MATDEKEIHEPNSYFAAFADIAAALDALAKAVTPDAGDDGTPPDSVSPPRCNSYFESFGAICDALVRLKDATEERIAAGCTLELAEVAPAGGVAALKNHAVNSVALAGGAVAFAFPAALDGRGRSFVVRLTMMAATEWTLPADARFVSDGDDAFSEVEAGATAVFIFTEISNGLFMVSRKTVTSVAKG